MLFKNMSFRRKLLAYAAGISLLSLFLACSAIVYYDIIAFRRSLVETTSAEADILAQTASSAIVFFDSDFATKVLAGLEAEPHVVAACIYTRDGVRFAEYSRKSDGIKFPDAAPNSNHTFTPSHLDVFRPILFEGEAVGAIFIRVDIKDLSSRVRGLLLIVVAAMAVSLVAALFVSFVFQRIITRPVTELANTARKFSRDNDYSARAALYSRDELGELTKTFNDMLDQIQTRDAALQESEERNRSLLENLDLGVALIDTDFNIVVANPEYCRRAKTTQADILGKKCYAAMHMRDSICPECPGRETIRTGHDAEIVIEQTDSPENPAFLRIHTFPMFNQNRHVRGFIALSEDITKKKNEEKEKELLRGQLIQSQKMEAVGQLAGGMAHDFNNMLAVIMGNASLGQIESEPGGANIERFTRILDASDRARSLTLKLLTFSRKEQINVQDIWMHNVIDELVTMLTRTLDRSIEIKTFIQDKCLVHIDKNQIQQALLNVCVNAGDAMPEGGVLTLECRRHTFDGTVCRDCGKTSKGDFCMLQVSDTGVGMSDKVRQKVMEPFFTTKGVGKGTGLGLSVTHGIVESHKGHIHIYSEINRGTCIRIYLPLSEAAEEADKSHEEFVIHRGTETVLIVDDEPEVLDIAAALLKKAGYTPIPALGGPKALEIFHSKNGEIDIVLLDMIMPGLSGSEVYDELKKHNPGIAVLLASGFSINGQAGELLQKGVQGFVQKPFDIYSLTKAIREVLKKK
jgi:PAS domain S-box-containing protein